MWIELEKRAHNELSYKNNQVELEALRVQILPGHI